MGDAFSGAWQAPLPTILVLAGIVLVLLSVGATIKGVGGHVSRKGAGAAAVLLLVVGLGLHVLAGRGPAGPGAPPTTTTAQPSASPPSSPAVPYSMVYRSGPWVGGPAGRSSGWHRICSDPPPQGFALAEVDFRIEGGSGCGAGAECRGSEGQRGEACWEFRLQGRHEEPAPPSPASSEGVLTVTFSPHR